MVMHRSHDRRARGIVRLGAVGTSLILVLLGLSAATPPVGAATLGWGEVTSGFNHTCALTSAGVPYCWGDNSMGQLGQGVATNTPALSPVAVTGLVKGRHFIQITAGDNHTCALDDTETIFCWGSRAQNQLGDGVAASPRDQYSATPVQVFDGGLQFSYVAAGGNSTCALSVGARAYCWGDDSLGQLGIGVTDGVGREAPVAVNTGGALSGLSLKQIAVGGGHTCALDINGVAYCWGWNGWGQLGDARVFRGGEGGITSLPGRVLMPTQQLTSTNVYEPMDIVFSDISLGDRFTCAIGGPAPEGVGAVWCWGFQDHGRLGDGSATSNGVASRWNPDEVDVTIPPFRGLSLTSVRLGGAAACVLDSAGTSICWGDGSTGQIGDGTARSTGYLPSVVLPNDAYTGSGLADLSVGANHVCGVVRSSSLAVCWGSNGSGQLGVATSQIAIAPLPQRVLSLPTGPTTTSVQRGSGLVTVSWAPPTQEGSSPVRGYDLTLTAAGLPAVKVRLASPDARDYTFRKLTNGVLYTVFITAYNAYGDGDRIGLSASPASRPGAPLWPKVTPSTKKVFVTWQRGVSGGLTVTSYQVRYRKSTTKTWSRWFTTHSKSYTVTGLKKGSRVYAQVRAVNALGISPSVTAFGGPVR